MKVIKLNFLTAILLLAACTSAQASLVGSSVTFSHAFSADGGLFLISGEETIGVEAGIGDVYNFNDIYTVNPEAASFNVDFLSS
ncbi:MAG: hypothetical protein NUV91_04555, partial [Candidatus Omnitrophica bacterium]|nr:hypothetical protein [Candidatus Omnitrophota bacterium]